MVDDTIYPPFSEEVAAIAQREIDKISASAYTDAAWFCAENSETPIRYSKSDTNSQSEALKLIRDNFGRTDECTHLTTAFNNLGDLAFMRTHEDFDEQAQKKWQTALNDWRIYLNSRVQKCLLPESILEHYDAASAIATRKEPTQKWIGIAQRREENLGVSA